MEGPERASGKAGSRLQAVASQYEARARARKVEKLLAASGVCHSLTERETLATLLEKAPDDWRERFAYAAGVNVPSATTWAEFVKAVRCRPLAMTGDPFARVAANDDEPDFAEAASNMARWMR